MKNYLQLKLEKFLNSLCFDLTQQTKSFNDTEYVNQYGLELNSESSVEEKKSNLGLVFFFTIMFSLFGFVQNINAQAFTQGNLAVFVAAASTSNTTGSIVEINSSTANQTAITTHSIAGTTLRFSGSATSTAYMANSSDGTLLTFTGGNTTDTSSNINTILPRGVGTYNAAGTFNLATTWTGASGQQTRCATTLNNTTWFIGDQNGFYSNGTTTASPTGNYRGVKSSGGLVYAATASSIGTISAPTGGTFTGLTGIGALTNVEDFYLIQSGSNGSTYDVLYIVTNSNGSSNTAGAILKYSLVSGSWTANGSYTTAFGGFGMTAKKSGSGAELYVSTGAGALTNNSLLKLTDSTGYNTNINITTGNNVTLYTATGSAIIKGVAFAPVNTIPTVTLSVSSNTGTEAGTNAITVTATASSAVSGNQTVALGVSGTNITAGDYSLSNSTITILNGQTTGSVTFTIVDDILVETTETATLTISSPSSGLTLGTTTSQNISITDNDVAPNPTVTLSVSANTGTEAGTTAITVTATASAAVSGNQTVNLGVSGTNITSGDYSLSNTVITILNGQTTGSVTFTVTDDAVVESTETATLTLSNPSSGITLGTTTSQNITITDNDVAPTPVVTLSVSTNTGTEAGTTAVTVTATASLAVSGDQTVALGVSGTNITAGDYSLSNSTITILNGQTTGSVTFTVTDDTVVETTETATLTISNPSSGLTLGTTISQDIAITDNDVAPLNIDLSTYVRVGRYALPEPTRTAHPTNNVLCQEASGVAYNWDTDTLFIVGDGSTSVTQVSKTGELIDTMTLAQGSSPQGTEFYDSEGITYVGNGQFVMTEERDRQVVLFTYVAGTTLTRSQTKTVKLGTFVNNIGTEGLSYDPLTGGYIVLKEISPIGIFQTGIDFNAGTATNGSATTENSTNLFDPALLGVSDVADVFALSNIPALNGQPLYNNILVISQENARVVNTDRNGAILNTLQIVTDPGNPLDAPSQQHEGLTMDRNGTLYIVNENGGGDIDHPQLWVYEHSTVPNQAPTAVALANTTNSVLENTNTTAAIKISDILVTDDGLGTNTLSLSGADANFFQIINSALYIKAGTLFDYETKTSYSVTINVDDTTVGATPDASVNFTLSVTDVVNEGTQVATVIVSEVAPWSSSNALVGADWFEITNNGNAALDITGWKVDDDSKSFSSALTLNGITSIAAGESVIFLESATPSTTIANFKSAWFGSNVPANLQVGSYTGGSIGLSSGGDQVNIYDASGNLRANVTFGTSTTNKTFNNAVGLNNAAITTLSQVGVNDAFAAVNDTAQIGSPGTIGKLFISEVAPWASTNSPIGVDWFEVTNSKAVAVDITGWKMDDNSQSPAAAVALNGITSINPGESVIFMETNDLAGKTTAFLNNWFGTNPSSGIRIGNYTGSGVGLGSGGDQVNLYNATGSTPQASVLFGTSPTTTFATFDNSAGLNGTTTPITQLSAVGVKGAFIAANSATEIGSPGTIVTAPCPTITATATPASSTVCAGSTTTVTVTATGGTLPYRVTGSPLTVGGGTFNYTITDAKGCTATASVTITETPVSDHIVAVSACDTYTWSVNGQTYTTSGLYTGTTTNCVTEKLNLTITPSTSNTTTVSAYDTYTWSVNGQTYTTSGNYPYVNGCITENLVLTINPSGTKIIATQCGTTVAALNSIIFADAVSGATQYKFEVTYDQTTVIYINDKAALNLLSLPNAAAAYNRIYSIRVATNAGNGTDFGSYGTPCNITTPVEVLTQVKASICGTTLATTTTVISADAVGGNQGYRFEVSENNIVVGTIDTGTGVTYFRLTQLPAGTTYSKTYSIRVAALINGVYSNFGTACNVSTPAAPLTKLTDALCNTTLASTTTAIGVTTISGAQGYKFEVSEYIGDAINPTFLENIETGSSYFRLTGLTNGTSYKRKYQIRVAGKFNGEYADFGQACTVTTPNIPLTKIKDDLCNTTLASLTSIITANTVSGIDGYRFEVSEYDLNNVAHFVESIDAVSAYFRLTQLTAGTTYSKKYAIRVAAKSGSLIGDFGASCDITTPLPISKIKATQCGVTLAALNTPVACDAVTGAQGYKFEVKENGVLVGEIPATTNYFRLTQLSGGTANGKAYSIAVSVKFNGTYGDYNETAVCTVYTPGSNPAGKGNFNETTKEVTTEETVAKVITLKAYPNPFVSTFKLDYTPITLENVIIKVYDMNGRQIETRVFEATTANDQEFGTQYAAGIYNVNITQGNNIQNIRVIKN